jgi:hypothetical protein
VSSRDAGQWDFVADKGNGQKEKIKTSPEDLGRMNDTDQGVGDGRAVWAFEDSRGNRGLTMKEMELKT